MKLIENFVIGTIHTKHNIIIDTDINAAAVESVHSYVKSLTFLTDHITDWYNTILKYHSSSGLRVPTNLKIMKKIRNTPREVKERLGDCKN